jgi:acyl-coenzyme A thioesterase PaaI-like protein
MERHYWDVPERLVKGPWAEKRRLAKALRRLVSLCVTTEAPEALLAELAHDVETACERLEAHPSRTFQDGFPSCRSFDDYAVFTDRATLVGECNPYSPPMKLYFEDGVAVAIVTFGPAHEGAPGLVHGGLVAAAFDQLFGYLQVRLEKASMTRVLTVNYEKPTPFRTELRLEGHCERSEGRRHYLKARLFAHGEITAEAEGIFVSLPADGFMKLFERGRGYPPSGPPPTKR